MSWASLTVDGWQQDPFVFIQLLERWPVEVKIGVHNAPRELVVESDQSPEEVDAAVRAAIADEGVLELTDERGRKVLVRAAHLAYVEIGEPVERRVGFGTL
jgi:predicted methyltransferase MtxX (methanogen marker protein 4)